jgi:hypothetical protein
MMRAEPLVRLAMAGFLGAVTWFAIGDLSSDVVGEPDYLWKAGPSVSPAIAVVGALSLAALIVWARAVWDGWSRSTRVRVVLLAALVGVGSALTGRVVTAGVGGANIGGALLAPLWILVMPGATFALLITRGPRPGVKRGNP